MLDFRSYSWTACPMKREKKGDGGRSVTSCKLILSNILEEERLSMMQFFDLFQRWRFIIIFTQIFTGIYPQRFASRLSNPRLFCLHLLKTKLKLNSVALVRERTIPTERPPPVGEVSGKFYLLQGYYLCLDFPSRIFCWAI
jgi:hypothetical protein